MDFPNAFFNTEDFQLTNKELGSGSFGTVYIAKNIHNLQNYAIKILRTNKNFNGNEQMQLMRESMILHQLKHSAIIHFKGINFQSFKDPKILEPSIITEYLPNGSLKQVLDQEKRSIASFDWSPTKKMISLYGISNALKYLHENNIIHRDLKPQNVLVDFEYYPRVCDFGLSRYLTDLTENSLTKNIGTPLYMAPELLKGDKYDLSVDVYAFAILAYEIVS